MRYPDEHKEETRKKILTTASREFRRKGAGAMGVAELMQATGLTHGGFYRHFMDKQALLSEAVRGGFLEIAGRLSRIVAALPREQGLRAVIEYYLSEQHLEHPEAGCPLAALGTELARYPRRFRSSIGRGLDGYVRCFENLMPGSNDAQRRASLLVLFPSMAGCMMAARTHGDSAKRREILQAAKEFFINAFCVEGKKDD